MAELPPLLLNLVDVIMDILSLIINTMIDGLNYLLELIGLSQDFTGELILTYLLAFIILVAFFSYAIRLFGKWIYNSVTGLLLLFLLHFLFDVTIPLNIFTIVLVALFGVPAVIAILILYIGGAFPG